MALFGNQHRYCPNCGKHLYDNNIQMNHVMSLLCSSECREFWNSKYARCLLGQSASKEDTEV